jgi:hypothetical protein
MLRAGFFVAILGYIGKKGEGILNVDRTLHMRGALVYTVAYCGKKWGVVG